MITKDYLDQEIENELSNEQQHLIWNTDFNGNKLRLDIFAISELLMKLYHFKTIGDSKKEIYYYEDGIYKKNGEDFIKSRVQNWSEGRIKNNQVNEIVGQIQRSTFEDREVLDNQDPRFICVKNGILDLMSKKLEPHSPKRIFTTKLNWKWNPNAKCERIIEFFEQVLKKEDIPVLQEFMGYILYRDYLFKKAVIFVGERDTGKTTTNKLIVKFIGKSNTSAESLHRITSDRFSAYSLYGKMLNNYDDLPYKDVQDNGLFKIATGGGYLPAEKKFGDRFQFKNYAKLLFATNKISATKDVDDEAYYSRWIIFFFNNTFDSENPKTDPKLIEKITTQEEMEGLLVWSVEGLNRLLKNQKFSYKLSPNEIKLAMERSSNTISAFVQDCLMEGEGWISKEDLYAAYSEYVNITSGARETKEKFGRDIQKKAPFIIPARKDTQNKKSEHGWNNIQLNTSNTTFKLSNVYKEVCNIYDINNSGIFSKYIEEETIMES